MKNIFSLIYYSHWCLSAEAQNFVVACQKTWKLGSHNFSDVIYLNLPFRFTTWMNAGHRQAEFNAIYLWLRWNLEDFNKIVGWAPI